MKIWLTRHGQTRLNLQKRMQGLTDEPLNATGIRQAEEKRALIGDEHFDAVFASPLSRAITTGAIIGGVEKSAVRIDKRLIEADFGRYEQRKYFLMGPWMTLYWALPEIIPAPPGVESIASLVARSRSFLAELEKAGYDNVLIACHGGIMRALSGYLEDKPNGITWRPKPHNCEIRIYEYKDGKHQRVGTC